MEQIFQKNKAVISKTPLFVTGHLVDAILFVLTLTSDRAVLNGDDVFSILVVSTKKPFSSFLKKVLAFQKICFKVKVLLITFETFPDCHIKHADPSVIFKIPSTVF